MRRPSARRATRLSATLTLLLYLSTTADLRYAGSLFTSTAAAAETADVTVDPFKSLGDQIILEPFPEAYKTTGPSPLIFLPGRTVQPDDLPVVTPPAFTVSNPFIGRDRLAGGTVKADFWVKRFTALGRAQLSGNNEVVTLEGLPIDAAEFTYPLPGELADLEEGLYHWSAILTPVAPEPVECPAEGAEGEPPAEPCPEPPTADDLKPETTEFSPLIKDQTAPVIEGLAPLRGDWLGLTVRDAVAGVAMVEARVFAKGTDPKNVTAQVTKLAAHPRRAVVRLDLDPLAGENVYVQLTVTDWAGNQSVESLPLYPLLRTPQLGAGAPFPSHTVTAGGQPIAVNLVTGNGLLSQTEWTFPALTTQLPLARTYNHQFRQKGLLGWGWRLSLETDLTLYKEQSVALWYDLSGTEYRFSLPEGTTESQAIVDGLKQPWPRLAAESNGYRLRFASGEGFRFDKTGQTQQWLDMDGKDRVTYQYEAGRLARVLLTGGQVLYLSYDKAGQVEQITGDQIAIRYSYNEKAELESAIGPNGQQATFDYDEVHRLTGITNPFKLEAGKDPVASTVALTYRNENRLREINHQRSDAKQESFLFEPLTAGALQVLTLKQGKPTDAEPWAKVRYDWDLLGRTTAVERFIGPYSLKQQFGWSGHNLVSVTDPSNDTTHYEYDKQGSLTQVSIPDGHATEYRITYGPDDRPTQVQTVQTAPVDNASREMAVTTTTIENGRPTKVVGPRGETSYAYDVNGLLRSVETPLRYVTRYEYDSRGLITKVTDQPDAIGEPGSGALSTTRTWDVNGRLESEKIDLGGGVQRSATYAYATSSGVQSVTVTEAGLGGAPATKSTTLLAAAYLPGALPLQVTRAYASGAPSGDSPSEYSVKYTYNTAGLLMSMAEPAATTNFAYDSRGYQILQQQGPAIVETQYDDIGRPIIITNSLDGTQYRNYGLKGRQLELIEDAGGGRVIKSTSRVDWAGRTAFTQSQVGSEVSYTYGATAAGYFVRLETREPEEPGSAKMILKRTIEQWTDPKTGVMEEKASGTQMAETYRRITPDLTKPQVKTEVGTKGAEKPDQVTTQLFDGRGRLIRAAEGADPSVQTALTYTYDGLNRVIESREPRATDGTPKQAVTAYSYDQFGSVLESKSGLVDGTAITWEPPQRFTWSLTGAPLTITPGNDPATSYKYNDKWQLENVTAGQTTFKSDYDPVTGFLTKRSASNGASSGILQSYTHNSFGAPLTVTQGTATWQYRYDGFSRLTQATDPNGHTNSYGYNLGGTSTAKMSTLAATTTDTTQDPSADLTLTTINGGYVLTRTNPDKTTEKTVYNASGQVIKRIDTLGKETSFTYDGQGRLVSRKDALGKTVSFEYDAIGRLTREVDAKKNETTYRYPDPYTIVRTDPEGTETTIKTDVVGRPVEVIDGNGNPTRYTYNADGRLAEVSSPTGLKSSFKYNGRGELVQITDPGKTSTTYQVDPLGLVTGIANAKQESESYTYNYQGKVTQHTSYEGYTTSWSYDAAGRVTTKLDPIEGKVEYTYYPNGLVKTKKVAGQHLTTYEYDARDQLTKVTEPGDKVTSYQYDSEGHLKVQIDPEGNRVEYDYDDVGRRTLEKFSDKLWIKYEYDANGNLLSKVDSAGGTTAWTYDKLNRPTYISNPDGTWVSRTYDGVGNVLTETGPAGTTTYTYTPENRVATTTTPDGTKLEISYDSNGNITGKKRNGQPLDYDYDETNRVRKITDDLGYEYFYEYDKDGYVTEIKYPNGLVTSIVYDKKHNVISQETKGSTAGVVSDGDYTHENRSFVQGAQEDGRSSGYGYDGRGQMTSVTTPRGDEILYTYDGAGNLLKREAVIGGEWNGETLTVDELMGMLLEPAGDAAPAEGEEAPAEESGATPIPVATIHGRIAMLDLGLSDVGFGIAAKGGGGGDKGGGGGDKGGGSGGGNAGDKGAGNGAGNGNAGGNGNGNAGGNGKGNAGGNGNAQPGKKDPCDHALTQGKGAKVGLYKKCYGEKQTGQIFNLLGVIDNIVNGEYLLPPGDKDDQFARVREVAAGYKILGTTYTYNAQNQLLERTNHVRDEVHPYSYDDRGNLTSNGRITYTWNAQNQLVNVLFPDGEGVKYTYDAQGRRSSRTTYNAQGQGQHVTTFEYEGNSWSVLRERNKDGAVTAAYTYDLQGRPLTISYGGAVYWYVFNAHGDVVALTDASGKVAARYEYDEWGRLFAMYDGEGNQVKEGYGNIGDIGTGPTRPATGKPTPGTESVKPGKGNGKKSASTTVESTVAEEPVPEPIDEPSADEIYAAGVIGEPDELVKANPYRYAGYRYDRETQYYYLRTRYYDTRTERFLSQDTWTGNVMQPLTLNRYIYVVNNPVNQIDPSGREVPTDEGGFEYGHLGKASSDCTPYDTGLPAVVPATPNKDKIPDKEEQRFILQVNQRRETFDFDLPYGFCAKELVAYTQRNATPKIPVDRDVMIGSRTWRLIVDDYTRQVERLYKHRIFKESQLEGAGSASATAGKSSGGTSGNKSPSSGQVGQVEAWNYQKKKIVYVTIPKVNFPLGSPLGVSDTGWGSTDLFGPRPKIGKGYHSGTDHAGPDKGKAEILAPVAGVVRIEEGGDWGNHVFIDAGEDITFLLAHFDEFDPDLEDGAEIKAGTPLGTVGETGLAFGVHLHWEVWLTDSGDWIAVDPYQFYKAQGAVQVLP